MCGILGSVGCGELPGQALDALAHRGPDDVGTYYDPAEDLYLGHRRLSILDLSRSGRQPMSLEDQGVHLAYNGEIYNFAELKAALLPGCTFNSQTDTEVLLNLLARRRYETPRLLRGMFAYGVYEAGEHQLTIARDRLGIKPLFFYEKGKQFAFSSELAALKAIPGIDLSPDPVAFDRYFTYGYMPAPLTAYRHVRKIQPGHQLVYDTQRREVVAQERYWNVPKSGQVGEGWGEQEWLEALEEKIKEAIRMRLISDVPLGAFLSGGIDSSLVVALMAEMSDKPVETFTIGFTHQDFDETTYAASVARRYNTNHHVETVEPDAMKMLPALVRHFGEPFADSSAIPTAYVSEIARKNVTVILSGDGGDEVFGGYAAYDQMRNYQRVDAIPAPVRKALQAGGSRMPLHWPGYGALQRVGCDGSMRYREMRAYFLAAEKQKLFRRDFRSRLNQADTWYDDILQEYGHFQPGDITKLQLLDLHAYLPEDVLTKVDRMSMRVGLEARVPLLDHEVVELALACPADIRLKGGQLKYLARRMLQGRVDPEVLAHAKQGFGIPLGPWFRGPWKTALEEVLHDDPDDPVIEPAFVRHLLDRHQEGGRNFGHKLYTILFYKLWRREHAV